MLKNGKDPTTGQRAKKNKKKKYNPLRKTKELSPREDKILSAMYNVFTP